VTKIEHLEKDLLRVESFRMFKGNSSNNSFIPKNLGFYFKNLISITISDCEITKIDGDELNDIPYLESFAFEGSKKLERIPGNLFSKNLFLRKVSFKNNNIKFIGPRIFDIKVIRRMEIVDFSGNSCIDKKYTRQFSKTLEGLMMLYEEIEDNCKEPEGTLVEMMRQFCENFNKLEIN
jgi:hypothetical protein